MAALRSLLLESEREGSDDQLRQLLGVFADWSCHVMEKLGEGGKRCAFCGEARPHIHWLKAEDKN